MGSVFLGAHHALHIRTARHFGFGAFDGVLHTVGGHRANFAGSVVLSLLSEVDMEIDDSEFESRRHEIVGELRQSVRNRRQRITNYYCKYALHKKECFSVLSGMLETVAAGSLVIAFLPDNIGWRPLLALAVAGVCYISAVKFRVDSKE